MEQARTLDRQRAKERESGADTSEKAFNGKNIQGLANREILVIQMWIKSLDIKTEKGSEITTLEQLKGRIREKLFHLYGLK